MVTRHRGDQFIMYANVKSLCSIPKTNIICTSTIFPFLKRELGADGLKSFRVLRRVHTTGKWYELHLWERNKPASSSARCWVRGTVTD